MKDLFQTRSLAAQLLLLGAVPATLMFIGLMAFFTNARLTDARQDLFASTQALADNLAPALEYAVVAGNRTVIRQVLSQSMKNSAVEWIRVTDVTGNEMGFVGDTEVSEWPGEDKLPDQVHRFNSAILQQPVALGGSGTEWFEPDFRVSSGAVRVGLVEVWVSEQRLAERRTDILLTSSVVGVSLLVLTLLLVSRMSSTLLGPIRALSERVLNMTNSDYREPPPTGAKVVELRELENHLHLLARNLLQLQESRDQTLALSESAREKAESASQAKTEFLALMSHELRTPLNGVLAMTDLVCEEPLSDRQADYLDTARRSTQDLLTLINDILDVSRLDQGTLRLESRLFDPAELASNCLASYRHVAEQRGLELEFEKTGPWPEKPEVVGDSARYRQVLACLLDNAIKFSDYGKVSVSMDWHRESEGCVFITCDVQDSGKGIPVELVDLVFNSFEQLDSSRSRQSGGTGIGLTLVQKLVELMGGHVGLNSPSGDGSRFRFEIPFELPPEHSDSQLADAEPSESATPARPPHAGSQSTPRALVVEDNLVNQRVAKTLLDRLGFDADAVANGRDALESVTRQQPPYTVILMDCHMPVMDGFAAAQAIREWESQESRGQTPIIALTADALPGTRTACLDAGMNDYLAKPVRKDQLRNVLSRWIPL